MDADMDMDIIEDILIRDREDHQGVRISGSTEYVASLISLFRDRFFDMAVHLGERVPGIWENPEEAKEEIEIEVEFPAVSKRCLDAMRAEVVPTVKNHHRLKIISSSWVELVENQIQRFPSRKAELEKKLREDILLGPMKQGGFIGLIHVHPEGKEISLRGGRILSLENRRLVIRREFSGNTSQHSHHSHGGQYGGQYGQRSQYGRYDGLDLPIEEGDYGITEIIENKWFLKHTYYSREGSVKGTYWNINTPIEFYPDHIRYLDLHIDLVQRSGLPPRLIDQEKLELAVANGLINPDLAFRACDVADSLLLAAGI